jgi:hypothetical protein
MSVYEDYQQSSSRYRVHDNQSPTVEVDGFIADHSDFANCWEDIMTNEEVLVYNQDHSPYPTADILNHVLGWCNKRTRQPSKFISIIPSGKSSAD